MRRIGIDARKIDDGGIGRYLRALLAGLPPLLEGIELVVLAYDRDAAAVARLAPAARRVVVRAAGYSIAEHVELGRAARAERLDLLHVPHYVLPLGVRCPVILTVHDLIHLLVPRSPIHRAYAHWMLRQIRRRAALVLTGAEAVARELVARAGVPRSRIRVAPYGVAAAFLDADATGGGENPEEFAGRHGVRRHFVLNVTNGLPHKGLDVLLAALAGLDGLDLVLAGQGSAHARVRSQVERARLAPGRVAILGELSEADLVAAYRAATAVVVASRMEGFGLPALEAMALGVPVVATDGGGLPEAIGDAGILVPAGSVACLRDALYRIAFEIDRTEREALIRKGRARAREFTWDAAIRATRDAYLEVLAGAA
jgi:glycosyltransferase involved in cell wall biosynthesis